MLLFASLLKNNDSYAKIVKGIGLTEVKELRKGYLFEPISSEIIDGQKQDILYSLDFGEKQMLVTKSLDFVFRENPIFKITSMQDIQKAICVLAQGVEEGFIKESMKSKLLKAIEEKVKTLKNR